MGCLNGKVAVITGAGNGIGRSHAHLFAREGAKVVVNDLGCNRDGTGQSNTAELVVKEIKEMGGEAVANGEAVGTMEAGERIVKAALDAFGRIDVLVNNAGILRDRTILNMSESEWDSVIQVHLKGTFACLKAAAAAMKNQGTGGRIINTSSTTGLLGNFGQANYGAAKVGIYSLTRIAALELAKLKITVNAIAPMALTRMMADLPQVKATYTAETMGPQFISPLVTWLASDAAAQVTGQTFGVEGNHLFAYRMMTSHGATKVGTTEPWTVEEIGPAMQQILNW
jgi:NAD(P)-dependent dehydrogenase (short-subunit alcohol dehydrogenase family)